MIINQVYLFLIFTLDGFAIGLIFDFFRILRKIFKTKDLVTYIEDILFWIFAGLIILYTTFIFNDGQIRLFMFLAIFIGITLYMYIFSSFIIKINVKLLTIIKNLISKTITIILIPFKYLYNIFRKTIFKPISFVIINVRNINRKITNILKIIPKIPNDKKKIQNN